MTHRPNKNARIELERFYEMGEEDFSKSLRWVDKEKVLDWLSPYSYENTGTTISQEPFDIAKVIKNFKNPSISSGNVEELSRDGRGAYTPDEVSMENDPWSKMAGYNIRSKKERRAFAERERRRMVAAVTELAERLGIADDVEIVTDISGLQGRQRRAKGIYRKSAAGQGGLFAGGIKSKEDTLKDVINFINNNYGRNKKIEEAKAAALERRKAEGIQQDDAGEAGG